MCIRDSARSGHSIVASMLDAHPHVVIVHEDSLFSMGRRVARVVNLFLACFYIAIGAYPLHSKQEMDTPSLLLLVHVI